MNAFGITDKSYQLILSALSEFPEVEEVLIFGSRAKGNYRQGSDIDLAISGERCTDKTAQSIKGLLNEEIPVPYHIDVICYNKLKDTELKEHIDRAGKIFFTNHSTVNESTPDYKKKTSSGNPSQ